MQTKPNLWGLWKLWKLQNLKLHLGLNIPINATVMNSCVVSFFTFLGWSEAFFDRIAFGWRPSRWPPLSLQTGMTSKYWKISLQWQSLLINQIFLYLLAKFKLHPSNIFWESWCWNHEYSFVNMISTKLGQCQHRNSRHADCFKSTNQSLLVLSITVE